MRPSWSLLVISLMATVAARAEPFDEPGEHLLWEAEDGEIQALWSSVDLEHWYVLVEQSPKSRRIVRDGQSDPTYEMIYNPSFDAGRTKIAYRATKGSTRVIVADGETQGAFDDVSGPVLSADGSRLAFFARDDGAWSVISEGHEGASYNCHGALALSADGGTLAYTATSWPCAGSSDGGEWYVVIDGRSSEGYERVSDPVFSADGSSVGYLALSGNRVLRVVEPIDAR